MEHAIIRLLLCVDCALYLWCLYRQPRLTIAETGVFGICFPYHRRPARAWLARDAYARQTAGARPVFEPGLARDGQMPRVVICIDTSSSINKLMLDMFAAEAVSIVRRTAVEAHLLGFDTEVHSRSRFVRADAMTALAMRCGGGTDFGPVIAEAQALDPSMIVVLTDLDAMTGDTPTAPVLWVVPSCPEKAPRFGEVLIMEDKPGPLGRTTDVA